MNKKEYITIIALLTIYVAFAQGNQVETYSKLELNYAVNQDLPENVVLGINGQVYIQDASSPTTRVIKPDLLNEFLLWVEKGVLSEDLAIGHHNLWIADYVFEPDYKLPSLKETQDFVQKHKHLPGIISQAELDAQGYYRINEMLIGQLKNLEELVLHTIAQEKKIKELDTENRELKAMVNELEKWMKKLDKP